MTNLANREHLYRDLFDFRRDFDHIFNRFLNAWPSRSGSSSELSSTDSVPAVNAYVDRDDKKFHCRVPLPGVNAKDINIQTQGHILSISGHQEPTNETDNAVVVYREWMYGSFRRDIALPEGVDQDKISAEYRNGVLEITAPISVSALPHRVEVKQLATAAR